MKTDWSIRNGEHGIEQAVERYKRYLENRGSDHRQIRSTPLTCVDISDLRALIDLKRKILRHFVKGYLISRLGGVPTITTSLPSLNITKC